MLTALTSIAIFPFGVWVSPYIAPNKISSSVWLILALLLSQKGG